MGTRLEDELPMARKFGGEFNLADWRIDERNAKLNSTNIFAVFSGWGLKMAHKVVWQSQTMH